MIDIRRTYVLSSQSHLKNAGVLTGLRQQLIILYATGQNALCLVELLYVYLLLRIGLTARSPTTQGSITCVWTQSQI